MSHLFIQLLVTFVGIQVIKNNIVEALQPSVSLCSLQSVWLCLS